LVAKGYTQTYGIDYEETFAPLEKLNTIRIIFSLTTVHFGWEMHQFDVKNVFLHGSLEKEVYMEIQPGYGATNEGNKVCKHKKALYGLNHHLVLCLEGLLKLWYLWGINKAKMNILCL